MNFIQNAIKIRSERKALNLLIKKLRPALGRLFGKRENYVPEQVAAALKKAELPPLQMRYGVCLYCDRNEYDSWAAEFGQRDYATTREELAELIFGSNIGFTAQDVSRLVASLNKPHESGYAANDDLRAIYGPYGSG